MVRVGHEHQEPAGQGYVGGDAGALHSQRVLGDLNQDLLVGAELLFDPEAALFGSGFEQHLVVISVGGRRQPRGRFDVRGVEEGGFLQSDVHEGRLHPGQHPSDPSLVDVADAAFLLVALDEKLGQAVVLHHGDPGFLGRGVDEDPSHGSGQWPVT